MEEKSYKLIDDQPLYVGNSLQFSCKNLNITHNSTNFNSNCKWEYVTKTNCSFSPKVIGCIPFFKSQPQKSETSDVSILLVEKYRLAVEKKVIEFPILELTDLNTESFNKTFDNNTRKKLSENEQNSKEEDIIQFLIEKYLKELKTLTGYSGDFKSFLKPEINKFKNNYKLNKNIYFSPWISDENVCFGVVEIDKAKEENMKVQGNKEIYEVKLENILDFIIEKINNEGYACSAQVFYFALGLKFKDIFKEYIR